MEKIKHILVIIKKLLIERSRNEQQQKRVFRRLRSTPRIAQHPKKKTYSFNTLDFL